MDAPGRRFHAPQFPADILSIGGESPKAEKLLITEGKILGFSLPKAENLLKISQLNKCEIDGWGVTKCPIWLSNRSRPPGWDGALLFDGFAHPHRKVPLGAHLPREAF
jgi:hypothetical protein